MPQIHPTAIVAPGAMLAEDVVIGPYCIVGEDVALGPRVSFDSHVVVDGRTTIGEGTRIFPFASIGLEPQDLKYRGESIGARHRAQQHDPRIRDDEPRDRPAAAWSPGSATIAYSWSARTSPTTARSATTSIMANNATLGRACRRRGVCRSRRALRGPPIRPDRQARDDRRDVGGRARRHPLRPGDGRPGAAVRAQHHRHAAPRLQPRGHPGAAQRLPVPVLRRTGP